jgi:hypothetical protein
MPLPDRDIETLLLHETRRRDQPEGHPATQLRCEGDPRHGDPGPVDRDAIRRTTIASSRAAKPWLTGGTVPRAKSGRYLDAIPFHIAGDVVAREGRRDGPARLDRAQPFRLDAIRAETALDDVVDPARQERDAE